MARVLSSSFARSLLFVIGGSIGAGMFGLPALFAQTGAFWGSIFYWIIVAIVLLIHMAYAELQAKAGSKHDLAGIAQRSLGVWGWRVAVVVYPISVYGATLVYLLLGAQFLSALSATVGGPTDRSLWQLLLWVLFAWGAQKGLKGVAALERPITYVLVAGLVLISLVATVSGAPLPTVQLSLSQVPLTLLVGVVFFTTISLPVIAEVMAFDGRKSVIGRRSILVGCLFVAALKWLFGLSFAGASLNGVVEVMNLVTSLPVALRWLLPTVGFLAISGAAVSVLDSLRIVYREEFDLSPFRAWLLALLPPLALLFVSTQSVLPIMSFLGSFVAATNALLVCLAALAERTRLLARLPRVMLYVAAGLCLFTIAHTFIL